MATKGGAGSDDLSHFAKLQQAPETYQLFQAMRIIEAHYDKAPRLGESRRAREDLIRLGQQPELAFPPSTIAAFHPAKGKQPAKLINRFFGLFGPHGPLPLHLTEYARDRQRNHRDPTLVAFADMLTHRMMGLFYRAWSQAEPAPSFDRDFDPYARKVSSIVGRNADNLRDRDTMPDMTKLHFAGHLSREARNPDGLVSILSDFFGVPVSLQEFIGSWLSLEPDDQWELGQPAGLGQSTSVGTKVWTRAAKFRLRIGPLSMEQYEELLPGGTSLKEMRAIVRNYVGEALDWDIQLILSGDQVPRASLGGTTRLGHTSWIGAPPDPDETRADAEDLFLYPRTLVEHQAA